MPWSLLRLNCDRIETLAGTREPFSVKGKARTRSRVLYAAVRVFSRGRLQAVPRVNTHLRCWNDGPEDRRQRKRCQPKKSAVREEKKNGKAKQSKNKDKRHLTKKKCVGQFYTNCNIITALLLLRPNKFPRYSQPANAHVQSLPPPINTHYPHGRNIVLLLCCCTGCCASCCAVHSRILRTRTSG